MAQIFELIGEGSRSFLLSGKDSSLLFNRDGKLRNVKKLQFWDLPSVLETKYRFTNQESNEIASFLLPMLKIDPRERAEARDMLDHPWIRDA